MSEQVSWFLELAVKSGRSDDVRALIREMVESTQAEPGALNYEWSISDDESVFHSRMRNMPIRELSWRICRRLEKFAERFLAADPKEALDAFRALYMKPFAGFARQGAFG